MAEHAWDAAMLALGRGPRIFSAAELKAKGSGSRPMLRCGTPARLYEEQRDMPAASGFVSFLGSDGHCMCDLWVHVLLAVEKTFRLFLFFLFVGVKASPVFTSTRCLTGGGLMSAYHTRVGKVFFTIPPRSTISGKTFRV